MVRSFYWILRPFFTLLLLSTAIGKLLDIRGFTEIIATYQLAIPEILLLPAGIGLSLFELFIGIAIALGIGLYINAILLIVMHIAYTILAIVTNLRGIALDNCGCFGIFLARPMTWGTVIEDSGLVLLSIGFLYVVKKTHS